ncbi:MAG TPA: hypothetical protein VHU85_16585 [Acidimicrobiales bacterium]|jgi:hypothetical protein|nr:hypothetical protein [Acidimicrobiales bacterium]
MRAIRLIGAVAVGALILASCSSSPPSSSSTTSGSGSSTTTPPTTTGGSGGAALSTVWPSCCDNDLISIGSAAQAVGNDVTVIGQNNGGSTTQLVADLRTFSSAVSTGLQSSVTAMGTVASGALASYNTALSDLNTATTNAIPACSTASNSCINDIQTIDTKLSAVNTAAKALTTDVG